MGLYLLLFSSSSIEKSVLQQSAVPADSNLPAGLSPKKSVFVYTLPDWSSRLLPDAKGFPITLFAVHVSKTDSWLLRAERATKHW